MTPTSTRWYVAGDMDSLEALWSYLESIPLAFTAWRSSGSYEGERELGMVFEHVGCLSGRDAKEIARQLADLAGQNSVFVVRTPVLMGRCVKRPAFSRKEV